MWERVIEVVDVVPDALESIVVELKAEHWRRNPAAATTENTIVKTTTDRLMQIVDTFHFVALSLRERRTGRPPLLIQDEYDVQYLLGALLQAQFEDVRPEEWCPSYAGSAARVDFMLKEHSIFIETKMVRVGLTNKKLGEELIIDIAHYKQRPDCKELVCFVYDPDSKLSNPRGMENDLSRPTDGLDVQVFVRPT